MKALILSDIHANIHALRAIWEHDQDSDAVYCTGDWSITAHPRGRSSPGFVSIMLFVRRNGFAAELHGFHTGDPKATNGP